MTRGCRIESEANRCSARLAACCPAWVSRFPVAGLIQSAGLLRQKPQTGHFEATAAPSKWPGWIQQVSRLLAGAVACLQRRGQPIVSAKRRYRLLCMGRGDTRRRQQNKPLVCGCNLQLASATGCLARIGRQRTDGLDASLIIQFVGLVRAFRLRNWPPARLMPLPS